MAERSESTKWVPTLVSVSGYPKDAEEVEFDSLYGLVRVVRATLYATPVDSFGYAIEAPAGDLGDALLKASEGGTGFQALVRIVTVEGKNGRRAWAKLHVDKVVGK